MCSVLLFFASAEIIVDRCRVANAAKDSLVAEGFSREEASSELGHRGRRGAIASLERQGFTGEGGTLTASEELARRARVGALASLERQGFTGEDGRVSASTEFARRGGEARSAIYRTSGNCTYPGCTMAIASSNFCKNHQLKRKKKSDKCRVCGQVFVAKERVRVGLCNMCYNKPEAKAARKKATAEKKAARGTCSTPGCTRITDRGTDKCFYCSFPGKLSK